jgi:hypothetical protein
MACFYCNHCDRLLDGDWIESFDVDGEEVCIDCHCELFDEDGNPIDEGEPEYIETMIEAPTPHGCIPGVKCYKSILTKNPNYNGDA